MQVENADGQGDFEAVAEDVKRGLLQSPRRLSPWLLYDARGSELFEAITELPEYYLTRTELSILHRCAGELPQVLPEVRSIVELGAGTATKTRVVLEAFARARGRVRFYPIDVSP